MGELRDKLKGEMMKSGWDMLAMHQRRDALLMVDASCDLLDVAMAVAEDRADEVKALLQAGSITRPTSEQVQAWSAHARAEPDGEPFLFVIVQPYVLAQHMAADA